MYQPDPSLVRVLIHASGLRYGDAARMLHYLHEDGYQIVKTEWVRGVQRRALKNMPEEAQLLASYEQF